MDRLTRDTRFMVALGANLPSRAGDPAETLGSALAAMKAAGLGLAAISRFWRTPAFPPGSGPDFVNACAVIRARLDPEALLAVLHRIEAGHDRARDLRWGARTLDLDLLAAGDAVLPDAATQDTWRALPPEDQRSRTPEGLILPHPRLSERGFVLAPLAEIAPGWRHPRTGQSVAQMFDALPETEKAALHPIPPRCMGQ